MAQDPTADWFEDWFDSPYYHILYQDRDKAEAKHFTRQLTEHLSIPKGADILDLACGKGRHAIQLGNMGYHVTGLDLSPSSIELAREHAEGVRFDVHDMREVYEEAAFDWVFNLFTSFGYFDDPEDDRRVVRSVHQMLRPGGGFVIDFLNMKKILHELVPREEKAEGGIRFRIERQVEKGVLAKKIRFQDGNKEYRFEERLRVLFLTDFEELLNGSDFRITEVFGDYDLSPYQPATSDRLIIVAHRS